jgi:hypothetical protein
MTYKFHSDAGHGWLEVPLADARQSGAEISRYSYAGRGKVFLEEDCDAPCFAEAAGLNLQEVPEVYDGEDSWIRRLPPYEG